MLILSEKLPLNLYLSLVFFPLKQPSSLFSHQKHVPPNNQTPPTPPPSLLPFNGLTIFSCYLKPAKNIPPTRVIGWLHPQPTAMIS